MNDISAIVVACGLVVFTLMIAYLIFLWQRFDDRTAAKKKLEKSQQEELEKVLSQEAIESEKRKIQEKIQSVGFIQKAKIAQNVIKKFPSSEFDQLKPMLTTASKKKDAIRDLNQKLINEYEEALLLQFGQSKPFPSRQDYDHLLKDTMRLGSEAIIEQYGITKPSSEGGRSLQESSREISDSGTWKDIKRRA